MRVFVFQCILNQTGNDSELTPRPNTYSLNIVQPQPDGPVEPAKYAYTYGVQVVLFFWKVFSWLLARWYTMLWKDGVTNNNFGQQESRDGYRLVFSQGISMGNYFLRGSWERHFGDSFQGAIFLEVSLRVEGWSLFSKADYNVCSSAQGEYFVNLPDGRLQKVPWWFVLFVIYFNQGDLLCKRWRRICGRSLLHWGGSGLARLCNGEDADHDHCAVCLWWQHYPQYPPEPAGGYGRK